MASRSRKSRQPNSEPETAQHESEAARSIRHSHSIGPRQPNRLLLAVSIVLVVVWLILLLLLAISVR